jgi:hypothetical protein
MAICKELHRLYSIYRSLKQISAGNVFYWMNWKFLRHNCSGSDTLLLMTWITTSFLQGLTFV